MRAPKTIAGAAILFSAAAAADAGDDFINHMTRLQYFSHKLGLAIGSENKDLQRFYAHEIEEQIEAALKTEQLDGMEVSKLMAQYLLPKFENLEIAVKAGEPEAIDTAYDEMLESCNHCHRASQRQFIKIERRADNPYMQSFE
ncbi:MAG: hypothetical protein LJE70_19905 [Chromatiaceae bacterium]|jgi:hypothetical protein|nr:hypothetical protein [Chromatiaceae bacterium]